MPRIKPPAVVGIGRGISLMVTDADLHRDSIADKILRRDRKHKSTTRRRLSTPDMNHIIRSICISSHHSQMQIRPRKHTKRRQSMQYRHHKIIRIYSRSVISHSQTNIRQRECHLTQMIRHNITNPRIDRAIKATDKRSFFARKFFHTTTKYNFLLYFKRRDVLSGERNIVISRSALSCETIDWRANYSIRIPKKRRRSRKRKM